jgi:hypothetical protein
MRGGWVLMGMGQRRLETKVLCLGAQAQKGVRKISYFVVMECETKKILRARRNM